MYFIALYSLASFATYGLGLSQTQGAALQSILSAAQMLGRPAWGITLDYGGRINMTSLCYVISGLSCLIIWLPAKSFGILILFALVQGFTGGTVWSAATPLTARIVGVKDVASALSIFWVICVPSALVGQPIAVALLEYSERMGKSGAEAYYISIGVCGGMGVLSGLCLLGAKRYQQGTWKVLQIT
jgi:MFS family permease